jgi:hypothetical protein
MIQPFRNFKPFLVGEGRNLSVHKLKLVGNYENVYLLIYVFLILISVCPNFFVTNLFTLPHLLP